MKRILGSLNRRASQSRERTPVYPKDSPEGIILKEVKAFCEARAGPNQAAGEEYLHLPAIVDAAESSPNAAREAALQVRKYLSKPTAPPGSVHYNAIMLIRILADNPGHTFTRNFDTKFVITVKEMLRLGRDMSVQQILRETLDALEMQRSGDENLMALLEMWKKEKEKFGKSIGGAPILQAPHPQDQQNQQNYFARQHRSTTLPPPDELEARISEARTSAKLLLQLVQSTPPTEVLGNDLIKEFSERCQSAVRSVQAYIASDNPAPDEETLVTLIETNDQLSIALSKYQRGILNARKAMGNATTPSPSPPLNGAVSSGAARPVPPPPVPPRQNGTQTVVFSELPAQSAVPSAVPTSNGASRYQYNSDDFQVPNPFADSHVAAAPQEERPSANTFQPQTEYGLFPKPIPTATVAGPSGQYDHPLSSNPV